MKQYKCRAECSVPSGPIRITRLETCIPHGEKNFILKACVSVICEEARIGGDRFAHGFDPGHVGLGEIAQDIIVDAIPVAGMANADPYPPIIVPNMVGNRPQTIMAG